MFATYVSGKALVEDSGDPVADLRAGWDTHIGFGLANAALFGLLTDTERALLAEWLERTDSHEN